MFVARSNGKRYVELSSLRAKNPLFFLGCGKTKTNVRPSIKKNSIPKHCVIYVFNNSVSNESNKKAQPYVTEEYANEWILDTKRIVRHREEQKLRSMVERKKVIDEERLARKAYDPNNMQALPDLITIEEESGFVDVYGKPIEIDIRGEKTLDGIVFKASDIEKAFGTDRLYNKITEPTGDYEYDLHYRFYASVSPKTVQDSCRVSGEHMIDKTLYLTYFGVVKYLFCSRVKRVEQFQRWALQTLFVHQFGTKDDKDAVAAHLIGVKHRTIANLFRRSYQAIPCIYLMAIGKVKDVKQHFEENPSKTPPNLEGREDEDVIYKFGLTKHLDRRYEEHAAAYGKWSEGFECTRYLYVDPIYLCRAEAFVKRFFVQTGMILEDTNYIELAVIPKKRMPEFDECLKTANTVFTTQSKELISLKEKTEVEHRLELETLRNREIVLLAEKTSDIAQLRLDHERVLHSLNQKITEIQSAHRIEMIEKENELLREKLLFYQKPVK